MREMINPKCITEDDAIVVYYFLDTFKKEDIINNNKSVFLEYLKRIYLLIDGFKMFHVRIINNGKDLYVITQNIDKIKKCETLSEVDKIIGKGYLEVTRKLEDFGIFEKKEGRYEFCEEKMSQLCDIINLFVKAYNLMPFKRLNKDDVLQESKVLDLKINEVLGEYKIPDKQQIKLEHSELVKYLENVMEIEGCCYSLIERYKHLFHERWNKIDSSFVDGYKVCVEYIYEIEEAKKTIINEKTIKAEEPILEYFLKQYCRVKPEFTGIKPVKPVLKEPGIFNKKKIEHENDMLLLEYNNKLENYEKAKENYNVLLQEYEKKNEIAENEARRQYELAMQNYQINLEKQQKINNDMEKKINEMIDNSKNRIEELLSSNENYQIIKSDEYEMKYIEECIVEPIKLKVELYSYNVIYGKYRNFIAISSFMDYFMSGRCDCLEGSTGAYNLYEQETKTDLILNKMDTIISKLDQIENNQYSLYSKLNEINDSLKNIENELFVSNLLQVVQVSKLNDIIDKTEEIAYNTKVTSFYAEKTAKYAKVMTYLTALSMN